MPRSAMRALIFIYIPHGLDQLSNFGRVEKSI